MKETKTVGAALVVLGGGAVYYGVDHMNSFMSRVYQAFGATDTTAIAAITLGVIAAVVGAALVVRSSG